MYIHSFIAFQQYLITRFIHFTNYKKTYDAIKPPDVLRLLFVQAAVIIFLPNTSSTTLNLS